MDDVNFFPTITMRNPWGGTDRHSNHTTMPVFTTSGQLVTANPPPVPGSAQDGNPRRVGDMLNLDNPYVKYGGMAIIALIIYKAMRK